jgi:hypothetical protein
MELLDYLISQRVHVLLNEIETRLSAYLRDDVYEVIDVEQCVHARKLLCKIRLQNDTVLAIREAYSLRGYELGVVYNYMLLAADESPLFSYDNSPHHPHLSTFPHHKHFYPKRKHAPIGFSGRLQDALEEIRWFLEKALLPR